MKYLVLLYIILNPIFFLVDVEPRDAQQLFFQLSSVLLFASSMFFDNKQVKKFKGHLWLGIFLMLSCYVWIRSMAGWVTVMNLILGILVYFSIIRTVKKEDIKFILKGVVGVSVFATLFLAGQKLGWDIFGITNRGPDRILTYSSFFFQNSAMGLYFAQAVPLLLVFSPLAAGFLLPILFSQCAVALAGAGVGVLFFFWFRKRIVFWCLLIPAVLAGIYFLSDSENLWSYKVRLPMWGMVIQDTFKNPLGYGWDEFANPKQVGHWKYARENCGHQPNVTFKEIKMPDGNWKVDRPLSPEFLLDYSRKQAEVAEWDHPHNEYLWLGYEGGLGSLIILGFIFYYIWQRFRRSTRDTLTCALMASLISIAICCSGQFYLHLSRVAHLLAPILAFFYLSTEEQ